MVRGLSLAILLSLAACYSVGAPRPLARAISVEVRDRDGVDVDLGAAVSTSVRSAIVERSELELRAEPGADAALEVAVVSGRAGLSSLADPSRRAAEYAIEVVLDARLVRSDGEVLWSSGPISGHSSYLGGPGPIVELDGDRRAALARAAEEAARRLVSAMVYAR